MPSYQIDNLIAIGSSFVIVLTVTLIVMRAWQRAFEARLHLRRQLIEKMSADDVARLLGSDEGRRALAQLAGDGDHGISGAMGRGATLILIGMALGVAATMSRSNTVGVAGLVAVAAGLGQLVLAWLIAREQRK